MSEKQKTIQTLFGIFMFCIGITMFHVREITTSQVEPYQAGVRPLESLQAQDVIDYITPLLISGNISGAAALLPQKNKIARNESMNTLLKRETNILTEEQKLQFILSAAACTKNQEAQKELFSLIERYKDYLPYEYALAYITKDGYEPVMTPFVGWILSDSESDFKRALFQTGLATIIETNNVPALHDLLENSMELSPDTAKTLLYKVVTQNNHEGFVSLLRARGADVNYIDKAGYTLLMHAVINNNVALARALLQENADPNTYTKPKVGTALQLALERRYVPMELLLRQYGARE